jgi:hypothetical protein
MMMIEIVRNSNCARKTTLSGEEEEDEEEEISGTEYLEMDWRPTVP